ncbi:MAG TPA: hypothetical protein VFI54_02170 [Solirubrobacteraceae bacterium]|nr:hypothetical protein [Solirubrobacteraceae bacterium]
MRVPFKTETDAFRVAAALGLLLGVSIIVGVLSSEPYGVVVFAAGCAAGLVFELSGRETVDHTLRDAASAPHPHGPAPGKRRVLVVAERALAGEELRRQLQPEPGVAVELDVLSPVMASRAHHWAGDIDRERKQARVRLEASLAWAMQRGFVARGEVGDPDAMVAIEDELRGFGADEVIIVTHPSERTSWLANRMLVHLKEQLEVPVREVVVDEEHDGSSTEPAG